MRLLNEARSAMKLYCNSLVVMLEQALEAYCHADVEQDKESAMIDIKKYSSLLVLLEPFQSQVRDEQHSAQLTKLCILLSQESYQEEHEQILLLTKIFRLTDQFPSA